MRDAIACFRSTAIPWPVLKIIDSSTWHNFALVARVLSKFIKTRPASSERASERADVSVYYFVKEDMYSWNAVYTRGSVWNGDTRDVIDT